jgi:DNA-binding transcriptional regulator/RsmH inhibitor MraZ
MLPAKWRPRDAKTTFTILPWPIGAEDRLLVLPPERWREMLAKLKAKSLSDPRIEALEQEIAENASQVTPDKVGRIGLLEEHAKRVNISNEAELVGRLDKFEIWEPSARDAVRVRNKKLAAEVLKDIEL